MSANKLFLNLDFYLLYLELLQYHGKEEKVSHQAKDSSDRTINIQANKSFVFSSISYIALSSPSLISYKFSLNLLLICHHLANMASYAQANPQAYPAQPTSFPPQGQAPYSAPPPVGYPTNDTASYPQQVPAKTKSRGDDDDGFWKGCCAALCCCCVLETCF